MRLRGTLDAVAEPIHREHFVAQSSPSELYSIVTDFPDYPRLFPEFKTVRVLQTQGHRVRVEYVAQVVVAARYVLDLTCDPAANTVDWTFVEGDIVTDSTGSWRFRADGQGTWIDYRASLEVRAPLPAFILRKVTDLLLSASIPAMFRAIEREVSARRKKA
jgi:ribosome-associated toxin RatA of RatAB toxin-antitoxin module